MIIICIFKCLCLSLFYHILMINSLHANYIKFHNYHYTVILNRFNNFDVLI